MDESMDGRFEVRGALRAAEGVVRIEVPVDASAAAIWEAVSTTDGLAGWLGDVRGELRVGGEWSGLFFPSGWDGAGRVLECEPGRRFLVESAEAGSPTSTDELELVPEGPDRSRVVLTKRGASPRWIAAVGVGLQLHLENLAAVLAGRPLVDPDPFWAALLPRYESLAADG
jgi:uncharacterized protein YndB with AHSA1/START domain